jgi:hypothetical protein
MAVTNQERICRVMNLLRTGLAPYSGTSGDILKRYPIGCRSGKEAPVTLTSCIPRTP